MFCRWLDNDKDILPQFRHLLKKMSKNNLTLFEKRPCIRPVWDPGSPSGLVLTCLSLGGGRERGDDQVKERIGWSKVKMRVCREKEERERESV